MRSKTACTAFLLLLVSASGAFADVRAQGTETELTSRDYQRMATWSVSSQIKLDNLLKEIEYLSPHEAKATILQRFDSIVHESNGRATETLMCSTLNRARIVIQKIDEDAKLRTNGIIFRELPFLKESIEIAMKYQKDDLEFLRGKTDLNEAAIAKFALEYAAFLMRVSENLQNGAAQFDLSVLAFQYLRHDLLHDYQADLYMSAVKEIDDFLKMAEANHRYEQIFLQPKIHYTYKKVLELLRGAMTPVVVEQLTAQSKSNGEVSSEASSHDVDACDPAKVDKAAIGYECSVENHRWKVESEIYNGKRVYRDMTSGLKVTEPMGGTSDHYHAIKLCKKGFRLPSGYPKGELGFPNKENEFLQLENDGVRRVVSGLAGALSSDDFGSDDPYCFWSSSIHPDDNKGVFSFCGDGKVWYGGRHFKKATVCISGGAGRE